MTGIESEAPHGESLGLHRLGGSRSTGPALEILEIGAAVRSLRLRDGQGTVRNVVLGNHDQAAYEDGVEYFGATVGRYANRIAGGQFALGGTVTPSRPMTATTLCTGERTDSTVAGGR